MWFPSNLSWVQSQVHLLGDGEHKGTSIKTPVRRRGSLTRITGGDPSKRGLWASSTAPSPGLR